MSAPDRPPPDQPSSGLPRIFLWLIGGHIALHACMASTRVAASLWVLRQGHDERMVGLVLSLFAVAPIVMGLWSGRLADRHGLQLPVRVGVGMAMVGALAAAVYPSLPTVALASLLTGGALSTAAVAIQREAGLLAHQGYDLKVVFSWVGLAPSISNVVSPLITGFIIDHAGLQAAFAWGIVLPLLTAWLVSRLGPEGLGPSPEPAKRAGAAFELLKSRPMRLLLFINVGMAAAWDAHTFAVPVIGHARDMSASQIGLILAAFAVAATGIRLFIAGTASRLSELVMLRSAMLLAAGVLAVYVWLPGIAGLMLGSALLGMALGSVQPMILSSLHQITPPERHGQALGLRMVVTNAATVSMPMMFGLLSAGLSVATPMLMLSAALLLAQWPVRRGWQKPQAMP